MKNNKPIRSFKDLVVYQSSYEAMIIVANEILPNLPEHEKYDLRDQLSRSTKAVPRLIAEGYAKRQQKAGFRKYLEDALAECNETIVGLDQSTDLYLTGKPKRICSELSKKYDTIGRQMYCLSEKWRNFH
jgi:four helix bundle protein